MGDRVRVYVAGPLSKGNLRDNVNKAITAGIGLLKAGYAPLVPHLSAFFGGCWDATGLDGRQRPCAWAEKLPAGTTHEDWMSLDLPWVSVADALVRLPGESAGADREVERAESLGIPVFPSVDDLIAAAPGSRVGACPPPAGHPGFHAVLAEIESLHAKKATDYGRGVDPLANCRASVEFGIPAWKGVMVRAADKLHRIKSYCQNGSLANEGVEDSLVDLASYAIIALVLFREDAEKGRAA